MDATIIVHIEYKCNLTKLVSILNFLESVITMIPNTNVEALSVLLAEYDHPKPGRSFGPVIRNLYYIECCTEGCGSITINGREFPIQAGDSYILLPGDAVRHTADAEHPRVGFSCALRGEIMDTCVREAGITAENPFIDPASYPEVRNWMEQLVIHWDHKDAGAHLRQLGCAYALLGVILRGKHSPGNYGIVDRAIGYMETNYPKPLTVARIANAMGLEQSYLSVLFKSRTGLSPYKYLTRLRVQKACRLLQTGQMSISEVADHVGLDSHNFARIFKRELGISPTVYCASMVYGTPLALPALIREL